jgi:hypothetical protein
MFQCILSFGVGQPPATRKERAAGVAPRRCPGTPTQRRPRALLSASVRGTAIMWRASAGRAGPAAWRGRRCRRRAARAQCAHAPTPHPLSDTPTRRAHPPPAARRVYHARPATPAVLWPSSAAGCASAATARETRHAAATVARCRDNPPAAAIAAPVTACPPVGPTRRPQWRGGRALVAAGRGGLPHSRRADIECGNPTGGGGVDACATGCARWAGRGVRRTCGGGGGGSGGCVRRELSRIPRQLRERAFYRHPLPGGTRLHPYHARRATRT